MSNGVVDERNYGTVNTDSASFIHSGIIHNQVMFNGYIRSKAADPAANSVSSTTRRTVPDNATILNLSTKAILETNSAAYTINFIS